jgi:hypothetical protein
MDTLQTSQPTSEEVNGFIQWFIEAGEIERLTRHQQIRAITLRSLELAPPPSYSRIGAIFGVKKGTISNHLSQIGWSSQTLGPDDIGHSISAESPYPTAKQGRNQWSKLSIKKGSFDRADRGRQWKSLSKKGGDNLRVG